MRALKHRQWWRRKVTADVTTQAHEGIETPFCISGIVNLDSNNSSP